MSAPGRKGEIVVSNGIIVWLDSDDVVVDFHSMFNAHLIKRGYKIPLNYTPKKYSYLDIMSQKDFDSAFADLGVHWPRSLKAFPGAAGFTSKLKQMGCRIIVITSIDGNQLPERIRNLREQEIYFDEIFATKGRLKSEFARELLPRYVDSQGRPCKNLLVDDYCKNVLEFIEGVPNAVKGVTIDTGYGADWLAKARDDRRINSSAKTPQELYEATLKVVARLIIGKTKKKA